MPEDRAALEQEIARLQDEVATFKQQIADLQRQIADLRAPPPPRPPAPIPPPSAKPDKNGAIKLPNQQDLDRARAYIADTWRRLVDMITQLQKDMLHQHDRDSADGLSRT